MRRAVLVLSAGVLLAGPALLALAAGGYREPARIVAGVLAWLVAAVAAVAAPRVLPAGRPGRMALGGLAALAALTLASVAWAPLAAPAFGDGQRVVLYLGVFVAAVAVLPAAGALRAVEPALVACAAAIAAYGLSERLVPWLVTLERSAAAGGRLNQPLGYWNAAGAVAAVGLVLAAGLAGDGSRSVRARASAAAAAPWLGAAVALSFSRGALLTLVVGLGVTLLLRPLRSQARAAGLVLAAAAAAGVLAAVLPGVADYAGSVGARNAQGAALAVVLVGLTVAAAAAQSALARRERGDALATGALSPRLRGVLAAAGAVAVLGAMVLLVAGNDGTRTGTPEFGATASRLSSVQSNRYAYWRVAAEVWAAHPWVGAGASAFAVEWLRRRTVREPTHDAHSLPLETAAELGLAGLAALLAFAGGVGAAARRVLRKRPGVAAGVVGALAAWATHASIDWAWEMPADTLFALLLAAAVIAAAEPRRDAAAAAPG